MRHAARGDRGGHTVRRALGPASAAAGPVCLRVATTTARRLSKPLLHACRGGDAAPVHRTPWALIVSAVVALILVMAGAGTAIAVIGAHNNGSSGNVSLGNGLPTPSPAGSPSPVGSPTAHVVSGPNATNDGVSIPLPAGWTVNTKDSESITLVTPSGDGSLTAASGPSFPTATAQQNKSDIDKYFQSKYPDTRNCPGSSTTNGTLNGAPGIFWTLCFTLTSGSQSVPAAASLFAGANSAGSVYYIVMLVTAQTNLPALVSQSKPLLQGLQWKLK